LVRFRQAQKLAFLVVIDHTGLFSGVIHRGAEKTKSVASQSESRNYNHDVKNEEKDLKGLSLLNSDPMIVS